jgi:hypothetical protein
MISVFTIFFKPSHIHVIALLLSLIAFWRTTAMELGMVKQ